MQAERGSFDAYLWGWVDGTPLQHRVDAAGQVPAAHPAVRALRKDLKKRGFTFVGPTIVYAYMQSTGVVNDHVVELLPLRAGLRRSSSRGRDDRDAGERDADARPLVGAQPFPSRTTPSTTVTTAYSEATTAATARSCRAALA